MIGFPATFYPQIIQNSIHIGLFCTVGIILHDEEVIGIVCSMQYKIFPPCCYYNMPFVLQEIIVRCWWCL